MDTNIKSSNLQNDEKFDTFSASCSMFNKDSVVSLSRFNLL